MTPFRLKFVALGCGLDQSVIERNLGHAKGFPRAKRGEHGHPVAVCGGGPSLVAHLKDLERWPGDIWAINSTADWLLDRGIDCTLFAIDPLIKKTTAAKRLLATCCDPALFGGDVSCFALCDVEAGGVTGGTTAATRAPSLALRLGYPGAVFFGCDSSFEERDHVDRDDALETALIVRADGQDFRTYPEYAMQAECLSQVFRLAPQLFENRSGGLVEAMTKDDGWEVVGVSTALKKALIDHNGDIGLYDEPYKAPCKVCGQTVGHYDDCPEGM